MLIKNPVRKKINSQWLPYDKQFFINKQPHANCHKAIAWYFEFSSGLIGLNGLNFEGHQKNHASHLLKSIHFINIQTKQLPVKVLFKGIFCYKKLI